MFEEKKETRRKILEKLKLQPESERLKKSLKIKELLFKTEEFKKAEVILFYLSFDGEVDTYSAIRDALKIGKIIAVPFLKEKSKDIFPCLIKSLSKNSLKRGLYGISQPKRLYSIDIERIDLVITPGVAFDQKGNRLGRGRGYYDRFLKRLTSHTKKIALAFNFQILPYLSVDPQDSKVDRIISA